jgi:hypothetical protein
VFANFLTKFLTDIHRSPAKWVQAVRDGRKEMLSSQQENNDGSFHKNEYIKEDCIVSERYRKAETNISENKKVTRICSNLFRGSTIYLIFD